MEKFPGSTLRNPENKSEKILTREEILEAISQHAEGFTLSRELSDEQGVYLKEVEVKGEKEGEVIEYQYMRKGNHPRNNTSDLTRINRIYYQDGMPVGGDPVAVFNEELGEWQNV